jgi:hypothetical protein
MTEINIPIEKVIDGEVVVVETKTIPIVNLGAVVSESEIFEPEVVTGTEEIDPLDNIYQEAEEELPQAKGVILPLFMRQGDKRVQLGDLIADPENNTAVANLNTKAGRDIMELIGTGVLAGITFGGMMSTNAITNKLN